MRQWCHRARVLGGDDLGANSSHDRGHGHDGDHVRDGDRVRDHVHNGRDRGRNARDRDHVRHRDAHPLGTVDQYLEWY